MEIKSIRKTAPNYPTLEDTLSNPELLGKNAPARWLKNGAVAGALGVYLLAGCKSADNTGIEKSATALSPYESGKPDKVSGEQDTAAKKVAPVFVHGDGRNAVGCIIMGGPVYMSEREAKSIILDEFEKYGIKFKDAPPAIDYIAKKWDDSRNSDRYKTREVSIEYSLDGYNNDLNLAFAYVSYMDYEILKDDEISEESVTGFSTIEKADTIRSILARKNMYNAAIFYDPLEDEILWDSKTDKVLSASKSDAKRRAKHNLKAQVADFLEWAKKEGLIK